MSAAPNVLFKLVNWLAVNPPIDVAAIVAISATLNVLSASLVRAPICVELNLLICVSDNASALSVLRLVSCAVVKPAITPVLRASSASVDNALS